MIIRLIAWLLRKDLSEKDMLILSTAVMHRLGELPTRATLSVDENMRILVNGRAIDAEKSMQLRESANAILNNRAYHLVREQIRFLAVQHGFHTAQTPTEQLWARAALWFAQQEDELFKSLAMKDSTL